MSRPALRASMREATRRIDGTGDADGVTDVESFPPVAGPGARVLVLGSMPSVESLRRRQYYGNPHNQFWPIMGRLVGAGPELDYDARLAVLVERGIALWDVARRGRRRQSADATIAEVEPNDIPALLARCRQVRAVLCNGRKAEQLCRRLIELPAARPGRAAPVLEYLPSTSPAHAGMRLGDKLRAWRRLLRWL